MDAHVFSEEGIVRLDAIESASGWGGGDGGGAGNWTGGSQGQEAQAAGRDGCGRGGGGGGGEECGFGLKFPPEGYVSISAPGRQDISASMAGDTIGPLSPGSWAQKLDHMCL